MKKLLVTILIIITALFGFVACTDGADNTDSDNRNDPPETVQEEVMNMYITVNGNKLEVALVKNSSVDALVEILKQGEIVFTATENGGFETYGNIGHTLPTNNTQMTAQAGDVILYSGNNICLFFGSNSWSYTKLGKINGYSAAQLKTLLGAGGGSIQVTISLK